MKEGMLRFALAVLPTLLLASGVKAAPIEWTLQDVFFQDGGRAGGSFFYDADTNEYSNVSITTTAGSIFSGASYSYVRADASDDSKVWFLSDPSGAVDTPAFFSDLAGQMTNSGGSVYLFLFSGYEGPCDQLNPPFNICDGVKFTQVGVTTARPVVSGSLFATVVVPIPAAAWLFGSALSLMGWMRRKST